MGKYMKKSKLTGEVSVMEVSTIGVRTRAKTLALQRLQNAVKSPSSHGGAELDASSFCYLQLRSRRLAKCLPPIPAKKKECRNPNPNLKGNSESGDNKKSGAEEIEPSFGENNSDFEARDRGIKESTQSSFTGNPAASIGAPVSATRWTSTAAANESHVQSCFTPSVQEIEEFFSDEEQQNQKQFMDKYNFDVVNDMPLSGRYEWVPVTP